MSVFYHAAQGGETYAKYIDEGELADARAQLPREFYPLLQP